jgi:hypothetical protein
MKFRRSMKKRGGYRKKSYRKKSFKRSSYRKKAVKAPVTSSPKTLKQSWVFTCSDSGAINVVNPLAELTAYKGTSNNISNDLEIASILDLNVISANTAQITAGVAASAVYTINDMGGANSTVLNGVIIYRGIKVKILSKTVVQNSATPVIAYRQTTADSVTLFTFGRKAYVKLRKESIDDGHIGAGWPDKFLIANCNDVKVTAYYFIRRRGRGNVA